MSPMRRADRRNSSDDNEVKYPPSRQKEPLSLPEAIQQRDNARADRFLLQKENAQLQEDKKNTSAHLIQIQQELQTSHLKIHEWKERATENHRLYLNIQDNHQQIVSLYDLEKARSAGLLAKYEEAEAQRTQYLTLYNEAQELLRFERNSKAGIKGWETRRKRENERLKREIGEMVVLLQESIARKDEAVNNLYDLAERMDKIQRLVESVEEDATNTPVGVLQKFRRIWIAIKEILAE
jgi:hypothetical protein